MGFKKSVNQPEDSYRHKGLRKRLAESLKKKGITNERVLEAIRSIPRHFFLDKAFEEWAYRDQPFPIGEEQTISQPFTVAYQTQLLGIEPREKILEVGTGSGYQAAVLAEMGARVFTVERHEPLYHKARELLENMGYHNVRCFLRDGWKGLPEFAPFDKIIVTAGASEVPQALLEQLAIGGTMVVPVGKDSQRMYVIRRVSETEYSETQLEGFRFVPMLGGVVRKKDGDRSED